MRMACGVAAAIAVCGVAAADMVDFGGTLVNVEYWSGSAQGPNALMLVVDFGATSYAFGYRWDNGPAPTGNTGLSFGGNGGLTPSGFDLIRDVADSGALDMTYTFFEGYGNAVDTISYGGQTMGAGGWPTDWLSYWNSADGRTWSASDVGASGRTLSNGSWDGWGRETSSVWPPESMPITPVPEPGTVGLALAGAVVLAWRRRRGNG